MWPVTLPSSMLKACPCCAARQAIQWLERRLTARGASLAMVTHDRAFMEATCTGVLELDCGGAHLHGFGGPGSYARFRQAGHKRRALSQTT